jgi:hypothetical protein
MKIIVPKELMRCFKALEKSLTKKDIDKFKNMDEDALSQLHHGFGTHIRNNFGLWGNKDDKDNSDVKKYFDSMGLHHADDMSAIIIQSWHRYLNKKSLGIEKQAQHYKDYWKTNNGTKGVEYD